MNQQTHFNSLAQNGFDFLQRAIAEFDEYPKYSVIHFCAAIEVLLKARLLLEHWTLVVSKNDSPKLAKFEAGDFTSITLKDCRDRIRDITGEEISEDAFKSFLTLANHRNKMVHFLHNGLANNQNAKSQIVAEQCRSWFYLHHLLNRWNKYFHDFSDEIAQADSAMKKHREYLNTKFNELKAELDLDKKSGNVPKVCSACDFEATIITTRDDQYDDQIALRRCRVCDHVAMQVEIECPHCCKLMVISNEGYANCTHCEESIKPEHIAEALTNHAAAHIGIKYGDDSFGYANCSHCESHQTVINRDDFYFCANCFNIFESISQCDWCNEYSTGDMEHSYTLGCSHCDGKLGWVEDD